MTELLDLADVHLAHPAQDIVRLTRAADMVDLHVRLVDVSLDRSTKPAALRVTEGKRGLLVVELQPQHLGEEAGTEDTSGLTNPPSLASILWIRAARSSRLVFALEAGEAVPFTSRGLLEAFGRLPLVLAPLAAIEDAVALPPSAAIAADPGLARLDALARELEGADPRRFSRFLDEFRALAGRLRSRELEIIRSSPAGIALKPGVPPGLPHPRPPTAHETALEVPYRLVLSPGPSGAFAHATEPVADPANPGLVELWATRLVVRDPKGRLLESPSATPTVRAIWARDMDYEAEPGDELVGGGGSPPTRLSLKPSHRRALVRQTVENRTDLQGRPIPPTPAEARRLWLSTLGATIDLHGRWPSFGRSEQPVLAWDHRASTGRDTYVRVEEPGYLHCCGHSATLVTITERKIASTINPRAVLYQRWFLVIGQPVRTYTGRDFPFRSIRVSPTVTPLLDASQPETILPADHLPHPPDKARAFFPHVGGKAFVFSLTATDHEGREIALRTPLLWVKAPLPAGDAPVVRAGYTASAWSKVATAGQTVAFADAKLPGDTAIEVQSLDLDGHPGAVSSTPILASAAVTLPALRAVAGTDGTTTVRYGASFLANGFGGANAGQVFLETDPVSLAFSSTEKSGGFLDAGFDVSALSRVQGAMGGDVADSVAGQFDPSKVFSGVKLFGLFGLDQIIGGGLLSKAPKLLTEQLDKVQAFVADATALANAATALPAALRTQIENAVGDVTTAVNNLLADPVGGAAGLAPALDALTARLGDVKAALAVPGLDPTARAKIERAVAGLTAALADVGKAVTAFTALAKGLDPGGLEVRAKYEWSADLMPWPNAADAVFEPGGTKKLELLVEIRAAASGSAGVDVLARMCPFVLQLLPGATLVRAKFGAFSFRSGSGRKPEVDVVFEGLEFVGVLAFVETLLNLIPLDGFSDPPFLDVTTGGVTAGFSAALPEVAVGVFSLQNISLGASVRIPFLGEAVTVGFEFCKRERPFTLAVAFLGGGGFLGLRFAPKGLVLLEMALEFGAVVALDFGVASGSVSAMGGVYLKLEGDAGSLTGYLRIRGEVDVLGLISASIELYMALTYEFATGKMVGRASLTIEVEVLFFSASVTIETERRFAGSNGDPTFAQIMEVDVATATSAPWTETCLAFAGA
jgi:hypothetical protein